MCPYEVVNKHKYCFCKKKDFLKLSVNFLLGKYLFAHEFIRTHEDTNRKVPNLLIAPVVTRNLAFFMALAILGGFLE